MEYKEKRVTPLHIAVEQQNNKSITILLKFLALLDYSQFKTFRDLWPFLIEHQGFIEFMEEQTFQTLQMQNKQTLKVDSALSEEIVRITPAYGSYVDEAYFRGVMGEQLKQDFNSFPVKIVGLEIGWLLREPEGIHFLKALRESENLDIYNIESTKVMIEYLYKQYKQVVLKWRLPPYLFLLGIFLTTIYLHETIEDRHQKRH